jgi:formate/nitrite transporter FocA (FNT family)
MKVMRLWGLVLLANLTGTLAAAFFFSTPTFVSPELIAVMHDIASHVVVMTPMENIIKGIPAGILIAAIVWMMPLSRSFSFFLILFFTYFISLGGFAHNSCWSGELAYEVIKRERIYILLHSFFSLPTVLEIFLADAFSHCLFIPGKRRAKMAWKIPAGLNS